MVWINPKVQMPKVVRILYPQALWRFKETGRTVYLTFDDGPVPEATPWVLSLLKNEGIKASFFCVGENVQKHPELFRQIIAEGHSVGNHTFNHVQGLKLNSDAYFANIEKADRLINSDIFRPPHGFLRRSQLSGLKKKYQLVLWDVLSRDFDRKLAPEQVVKNVMDFVRPGSVVIFHDSIKAKENMEQALTVVIEKLKEQGYTFKTIPFESRN
jgi:peptidoglycan-N-acetylglucosamine deacetylase